MVKHANLLKRDFLILFNPKIHIDKTPKLSGWMVVQQSLILKKLALRPYRGKLSIARFNSSRYIDRYIEWSITAKYWQTKCSSGRSGSCWCLTCPTSSDARSTSCSRWWLRPPQTLCSSPSGGSKESSWSSFRPCSRPQSWCCKEKRWRLLKVYYYNY